MGLRVAWSPEAADDLQEIVAYIARDSSAYARAVASRIFGIAKSLGVFPDMGRIVPELGNPSIRERFVYSFLLIYRIEMHRVLILAIVHGRRLLPDVQDRMPHS
jgi:toxin ParE1/3/4